MSHDQASSECVFDDRRDAICGDCAASMNAEADALLSRAYGALLAGDPAWRDLTDQALAIWLTAGEDHK